MGNHAPKKRRGNDLIDMRLTVLLVVYFVANFIFAPGIAAQNTRDTLVSSILRGSSEEKRDALFAIRNQRSESASLIAVPALTDADVMVRSTAAAAVVFLPAADAASQLSRLLRDKNEFVRREAAYALGIVGYGPSARALLEALSREKFVEARSAMIGALGDIGGVSALPRLTEILRQKPREDQEFLRSRASRAIGQIAQFTRTGSREPVTPQNLLPEKYKVIAPAVEKPHDALLAANALVLKVFRDSREDAETRRQAAFALGAIGDPASIPALTIGLKSPDIYLAEICLEAIAKIESNPFSLI